MKKIRAICIPYFLLVMTFLSCMGEKDLSGDVWKYEQDVNTYLYPYAKEAVNITTEIIIQTRQTLPEQLPTPEIPPLKYNKSWLMMLTQDDCKQAAYSCTWAVINGKPLSEKYFYDTRQLYWGDLPPDVYDLGKTLGSTDGTGNEVRFSFATTVSPGWDFINEKSEVKPGYNRDYWRFMMPKGLNWHSVREMLNYGCGIAFHNLNVATESVNMVLKYLPVYQDTVLTHLDGRGCKTLAEPDGNKNYVYAALKYPPIQAMTAQAGATVVYPYQYGEGKDLHQVLQYREFKDVPSVFKSIIENQLSKAPAERTAIHIGVHGTDTQWVNFLLWVNDTYGKDGDDSVWFPNLEEYYEYTYYRAHGNTTLERIDDHTMKLTVYMPSGEYFYYPSVTVNILGMNTNNIVSVSADDATTGFSYADYGENKEGIMLNIDCRRYLVEHATHFVEQYERDKSNNSNHADALYFVNMLKASPQKTALLNRIN